MLDQLHDRPRGACSSAWPCCGTCGIASFLPRSSAGTAPLARAGHGRSAGVSVPRHRLADRRARRRGEARRDFVPKSPKEMGRLQTPARPRRLSRVLGAAVDLCRGRGGAARSFWRSSTICVIRAVAAAVIFALLAAGVGYALPGFWLAIADRQRAEADPERTAGRARPADRLRRGRLGARPGDREGSEELRIRIRRSPRNCA